MAVWSMSAQYRETPPTSRSRANLKDMSESNPRPAPGASPPVTIYDVAHRAGVSASTVSRAFSRPDRVSGRTAAAIRAAGFSSTSPRMAAKRTLTQRWPS